MTITLLALGRAVYAFQELEWITIWVLCSLNGEYPPEFDSMTFGPLVGRLQSDVARSTRVAEPDRTLLAGWAATLDEMNALRQDVFHYHPHSRDRIVRRRPKSGEFVEVDLPMLQRAEQRFNAATATGVRVWYDAWQEELEAAWGRE
jgi:hypothetical protein